MKVYYNTQGAPGQVFGFCNIYTVNFPRAHCAERIVCAVAEETRCIVYIHVRHARSDGYPRCTHILHIVLR